MRDSCAIKGSFGGKNEGTTLICNHSNGSCYLFLSCATVIVLLNGSSILSERFVTIQMRTSEQHFQLVLRYTVTITLPMIVKGAVKTQVYQCSFSR